MNALTNRKSRTLNVINNMKIAAPCDARWEDMLPVGEPNEDKVRHCGDCRLNVYELKNMDHEEIRELLLETEGTACLQLYRRADGTVLTEDCPVGLAERAWRVSRRAALTAAASILAIVATVLAFLLTPARCDLEEPGFEGEQHEFVITVKEAQDKIEEKIPEPMRPMRGRIAMPRDWKADLD
jgi:hypothetical protein